MNLRNIVQDTLWSMSSLLDTQSRPGLLCTSLHWWSFHLDRSHKCRACWTISPLWRSSLHSLSLQHMDTQCHCIQIFKISSGYLVSVCPYQLGVMAIGGGELERLDLRMFLYVDSGIRIPLKVLDWELTFLLLKRLTSSYQSVTALSQSAGGSLMLCL